MAATNLASLAAKPVSPHTLRHTTALHGLQSGVELNVIKSWLGHVSITTTSEYIEIDMAMKRKAIDRCPPLVPDPEAKAAGTPARTSSNGSKTSEHRNLCGVRRVTGSTPVWWILHSPQMLWSGWPLSSTVPPLANDGLIIFRFCFC